MVWTHSATILWKTVVQQYSNAHHPTTAWYTEARQDGCKLLCWPSSQCCSNCDWSDETFFNLLLLILANPCKMKHVTDLLSPARPLSAEVVLKDAQQWKAAFPPPAVYFSPTQSYALKSLDQSENMFVAWHSEICVYHFEVSGTLLFILKSCSRGVFKERGLLLFNENACWMRGKE